jgi:hypothetical protein
VAKIAAEGAESRPANRKTLYSRWLHTQAELKVLQHILLLPRGGGLPSSAVELFQLDYLVPVVTGGFNGTKLSAAGEAVIQTTNPQFDSLRREVFLIIGERLRRCATSNHHAPIKLSKQRDSLYQRVLYPILLELV